MYLAVNVKVRIGVCPSPVALGRSLGCQLVVWGHWGWELWQLALQTLSLQLSTLGCAAASVLSLGCVNQGLPSLLQLLSKDGLFGNKLLSALTLWIYVTHILSFKCISGVFQTLSTELQHSSTALLHELCRAFIPEARRQLNELHLLTCSQGFVCLCRV